MILAARWPGQLLTGKLPRCPPLQNTHDKYRMRALSGGGQLRRPQLPQLNMIGKELMPHIKIKENEPFDVALRRFKRSCEKAGVLAEVR